MKNTMFDPFKDFDCAGYLRNIRKDKDGAVIKHFEHNLFRANLDPVLAYLASRKALTYEDFLEVHRILFSDYYPWAGQDRATTMPHHAVKKGNVLFSHPQASRLAIEYGLRLGQDPVAMSCKPGEIMGLFAYGHPFLDGNGRTILLVHLEMSYRAGFSIAWENTLKTEYLASLSREIETPGQGILDAYLLQFKGPRLNRGEWGNGILLMKGLDGLDEANQLDGDLSDPAVAEKYKKFEAQRGYSYSAINHACAQCGVIPAENPTRLTP
jgi:cell filamentation protein